jgi:TIR domain
MAWRRRPQACRVYHASPQLRISLPAPIGRHTRRARPGASRDHHLGPAGVDVSAGRGRGRLQGSHESSHIPPTGEQPELIFISCSTSRQDRKFLDMLMLHLDVLQDERRIEIFTHDALPPGTLWQQEARFNIERAAAAILLISPKYLVSKDLMEDQLPRLLEQAQKRGTAILPLLVEPSMFYHKSKLACFKPFNPMSRTLIRMGAAELREFLLSVAETVEEVIRRRRAGSGGDVLL